MAIGVDTLWVASGVAVGASICSAIYHLVLLRHHAKIVELQKAIGETIACKSFPACDHCGHLVGRYFIDGYGRTTCPGCKPEGYTDAVKKGTARG